MWWTLGGFYLNRDFIASNLCENRDKPKSGCQGACQLKKKLKENQEDSEKSGTELKQKETNLLVARPFRVPELPVVVAEDPRSYNSRYRLLIPQDFVASIFHPPATA